ncbi:glyoxylate reductase/hydroxypyruvate reductase-like isoform X2 [Patiria miniata]|nr:glyoxylate reductase/hydroxypyruvate reductase-like isoform X2 [Patiria miniata]
MSDQPRWKIYVTRRLLPEALDLLKEKCDIEIWDHDNVVPRDELLKRIAGKEGMLCQLTEKINKELLDAAGPSLRVVSSMSVGYDHVELQQLKERNVLLGNTPGVLTDATAELTVALLLTTSRRLVEGTHHVKNGTWGSWKATWMCGPGLSGSTVGLVGFGRIGQAIGQRLKPFGVKRFLYCGHTPKPEAPMLPAEFVSQDELLQQSDFVVVCCALTPETRGMFNSAVFKKMKKSAVFINTSRGAVVNQEDLVEALESGTIALAGLDVTTPEPLPVDHPLLKLTNCVVLPHIGSATLETRTAMAMLSAENLLTALEGKPMPAQVKL